MSLLFGVKCEGNRLDPVAVLAVMFGRFERCIFMFHEGASNSLSSLAIILAAA
jgi:hypothetical protein